MILMLAKVRLPKNSTEGDPLVIAISISFLVTIFYGLSLVFELKKFANLSQNGKLKHPFSIWLGIFLLLVIFELMSR